MNGTRTIDPGHVLIGMLLALGAAGALAQASAAKPANDKLMTRAELRSCFKQQEAMKVDRQTVDAERQRMDAERNGLMTERDTLVIELAALDALKADGAKIDATNVDAVNAYNARAADAVNAYNQKKQAMDGKIDGWNTRNATTKQRENAFNDSQQSWKDSCSNRRYREDDEKAVRAGR